MITPMVDFSTFLQKNSVSAELLHIQKRQEGMKEGTKEGRENFTELWMFWLFSLELLGWGFFLLAKLRNSIFNTESVSILLLINAFFNPISGWIYILLTKLEVICIPQGGIRRNSDPLYCLVSICSSLQGEMPAVHSRSWCQAASLQDILWQSLVFFPYV